MYYTLKDHQGSLAAVVHGSTVERLSYDPWGRRRNPSDFGYNNVSHTFDRGYTLHEHYDGFDMINMNGRMYDPVMSSFLSADRYVQDPMSAQGFNRYAYCMNNPLRYTDPSGWRPKQRAYGPVSSSYYARDFYTFAERAHEPGDFRNAYYLLNEALYGNMDGSGGGGSGGGGQGWNYYGSYGYYVTHNAFSVYNYTFPSAQFQLKRNWHNNPCYTTNKEMRDAGITNVTAGEAYGSFQGEDGYRNTYYTWTDSNGHTRTATALGEYVGGNKNGAFTVSNQPLCMYGFGNNISNMTISRVMVINGYFNSGSTLIGKGAEWAKLSINGTKVSKEAETAVLLGKISKGSKILGAVGLAINLGCTYVQVNNGYISWQEGVVRFGMSAAELGLAQIPYVGPILSIGVTAFDIGGGFDDNLYNTENWWK